MTKFVWEHICIIVCIVHQYLELHFSNEETANRILQKAGIYSWASTKAQIIECTVQLRSFKIKELWKDLRQVSKSILASFQNSWESCILWHYFLWVNLVNVWKLLVFLRLHLAFEKSWNYLWSHHEQAVNFLLIY